jgi:hypothetical protein
LEHLKCKVRAATAASLSATLVVVRGAALRERCAT